VVRTEDGAEDARLVLRVAPPFAAHADTTAVGSIGTAVFGGVTVR
jgi:hypothetical protein